MKEFILGMILFTYTSIELNAQFHNGLTHAVMMITTLSTISLIVKDLYVRYCRVS
ncbi:hypothetical protein [Pelosinus propionicus]|uniref:Uncharacterized protein n=1 Tax=Pelosinus propionicus DSM 13327 TaxID=1123291 RepID=A0A1I4PB96_9FIRM|nr:hypothetical protein [Pelosinus propionicus]SFM24643.1 hypothetical protein SAMN04490355_106018 [Pelosinus propionicus DSM 13327]